MDEYEYMSLKQGEYSLVNFNKRENLTMSSGFLNTRQTGIAPMNINSESRLKNIQLKNTKDQEVKKNLFKPNHFLPHRINNKLEPYNARQSKSCNNTSSISYMDYTFQPNIQDPQKNINYNIGKDTRYEYR